jgi:uncharacterized protein (TIGR03086 family)
MSALNNADLLDAFLRAQRAFADRVHAIREDQWEAPTPDEEWNVADLVRHLVEEHRWAAPLVHGQDLESAAKIVEGSRKLPAEGGVGGNVAEEWEEAATESANAFSEDGALDRSVALSRGPTPASEYARELTFDLVVHGWDLQKAIGYSGDFPEDIVQADYEIAQGFVDASGNEWFGPPVPADDNAPLIDKLVALTGRDPSWTGSSPS